MSHEPSVAGIRRASKYVPLLAETFANHVLVTLVEAYERDRWPIESLDPVSAIETAMTMNGYSRADFAALVGQSRATEVLGRKRALTLPMIRKIARAWHVPERVLVQEYQLHA
jgi:HTH-type transcriptional regulator/antitoxin HigA